MCVCVCVQDASVCVQGASVCACVCVQGASVRARTVGKYRLELKGTCNLIYISRVITAYSYSSVNGKVFHEFTYPEYLFLYNHSNRYHKEYMYYSCTSVKYVHTDILKRAYMGL